MYATLTQKYQSEVLLGNVQAGSSTKVTLVGYDGDVALKTDTNNTIAVTMPPLPLDTELRWAWTFKLENVLPNPNK